MTDPPKRPRGRPPTPQGAKPRAEVQRAYRARLAAAGKVVKLINPAEMPDLATFVEMRDKLHSTLLKLELREQDVARLDARIAYLDSELRRVEQHNLNALKDNIVLKKQLAEWPKPRPRRGVASDIP
jgi:hypothetical protein